MLKQMDYLQPYIPSVTGQPAYLGNELQDLTSDTPFYRGQGVPIFETQVVRKRNHSNYSAPTIGLQLGSRGNEVEDLQRMIGVDDDGIFGQKTQQALMAYQRSKGLSPTGMVDASTLQALQGSSGASKFDQGLSVAESFWKSFKAGRDASLPTPTTSIAPIVPLPQSQGMSTGTIIGLSLLGLTIVGGIVYLGSQSAKE